MDERILMEKIAGGDEAALHALLRQYGPLIRYVLRPILTDERDREECYADISLKIWQTAGSFDLNAQRDGISVLCFTGHKG